jgi:hypothetical protein
MVLVKRSTPKFSTWLALKQARKNHAVHVSLSQSSIVKQLGFYKTDRTSPGEPASAPASSGSAEEAPLSGGAVSMAGI